MINRTEEYLNEVRENERIKVNRSVNWQLPNQAQKGQARICNISTTGMLIETTNGFTPENRSLFTFDADLGPDNFIPRNGELVWYEKNRLKQRCRYGIRFVKPTDFVLDKLRKRIDQKKTQSIAFQRTEGALSALLPIITAALLGYVLWMSYQIYDNVTQSNQSLIKVSEQQALINQHRVEQIAVLNQELFQTQKLYGESEAILTNVSKELLATKVLLEETERVLQQARSQTNTLEGDLAGIEGARVELQNTVTLLEEKNVQLNGEMTALQEKIDYYSGRIDNTKEGRDLVTFYKTKMNEVRSRIREFDIQARETHTAALRERDRIQLLLGNNGFFMKNGKPVKVDMQKYHSADSSGVSTESTPQNVQIDVTFVD